MLVKDLAFKIEAYDALLKSYKAVCLSVCVREYACEYTCLKS